jgi:transposase
MPRFIEGEDRSQASLFPERLDDYIADDNPVRLVEIFVDGLDLRSLSFEGVEPRVTGRPAYHPSTLLKFYIYGFAKSIPVVVIFITVASPGWWNSTTSTLVLRCRFR